VKVAKKFESTRLGGLVAPNVPAKMRFPDATTDSSTDVHAENAFWAAHGATAFQCRTARFFVARELRAWRFLGGAAPLPTLEEVASRCGYPAARVAEFFQVVVNDEAQRELEVQIRSRRLAWLPGVMQLRQSFSDDEYATAG
jgi:hypothetical protein